MSKEASKEEWEPVWHPGRRRYYFQDRVTGKSCWSRPKHCSLELPKEPPPLDEQENPPPPENVPSGWNAAYDRYHKRHYYWRKTASAGLERTWFKPVPSILDLVPEAVGTPPPDVAVEMQANRRSGVGKKTKRKDFLIGHLWDAEAFRCRLLQARETRDFDHDFLAMILKEVFDSNEMLLVDNNESRWKTTLHGEAENLEEPGTAQPALRKGASSFLAPLHFDVPETVKVSLTDIEEALEDRKVVDFDDAPGNQYVTYSKDKRSVADAAEYLKRDNEERNIVVVNVVHRNDLLGKYSSGGTGFYEDLCRRVPALGRSLQHAYSDLADDDNILLMDEGDVLFTPNVMLARGSEEAGFPLLPEDQQVKISVITVLRGHPSGPKGRSEDHHHLRGVIHSLLVAPVFKEPSLTTLIVAPSDLQGHHHHVILRQKTDAQGSSPPIATALTQCIQDFVGSLMETVDGVCLGRLYIEHHFVFPPEDKDGIGVLKDCLRQKMGVKANPFTW